MTPPSEIDTFSDDLDRQIDRQYGDHPRGSSVDSAMLFLGLLYIAKAVLIAARHLGKVGL